MEFPIKIIHISFKLSGNNLVLCTVHLILDTQRTEKLSGTFETLYLSCSPSAIKSVNTGTDFHAKPSFVLF